ncbi:MAG: superfamily I DNA and/or RNA helicase [Spirosomataceae bacterium]|jgi:superfamily I DNA and/or RNA helicase
MKSILKSYLKRLTNLTARNRSLVLLKLPKRQFLDVHSLDFLLHKPSFNIVEQLIERQNFVPLCELLDPRDERTNEGSKQLAQISRTEKLIIEERGAEDLYVGYPIVKGKFSDGTAIRCPLLFFPVSLALNTIQKKSTWCLQQRETGVVFNRSFLLAYAHFNNLKITDEWLDFSFDYFPKNGLEFRTKLYETLKDSPLEINFNQDLFQNQLIDFTEIKKLDLETEERNGELKLYPQAVLGIFPQAGSYIAADYETLLEKPEELPDNFVDFFSQESDTNTRKIREEELLLPLPVDASQEETIKRAKLGKSLVVQGPPGTGKSQLIANLIADFTARGKRILVVCQKRAALDTVYNRLSEIAIDPFIALVHDFKNDQKSLFNKISEQIENIDNYEKLNSGLDIILLERDFGQTCREIDRTTRELDELKTALFDEQIAGKSIKEMYLLSAKFELKFPNLDFSELYHFFRLNEQDIFFKKIQQFEKYQDYLNDGTIAANFWKKRNSAAAWQFTHLQALSNAVRSVKNIFTEFQKQTNTIFSEKLSLLDLPENIEKNIQLVSNEIKDDKTLSNFNQFHQNPIWKAQTLEFSELEKTISDLQLLKDTSSASVFYENSKNADYLAMLQDGLPNTESYVNKIKWLYFGKYRKEWKEFSQTFKLAFKLAVIEKAIQEITNAERFSEIISLCKNYEISTSKNADEAAQTLEKVLLAKKLYETTKLTFSNSRFIKIETQTEFLKTCNFILQLITDSREIINLKSQHLSTAQIREIEQTEEIQPFVVYLEKSFDYLIENDQLVASSSSVERQILDIALVAENTTNITEAIEYNLLQYWIAHIENNHPILRGVSTLKVQQLEIDLQKNIQKKQELCKAIVLVNLREITYKNLGRNRLGNVTTYRELKHQVTKKRQLWSVRRAIENFTDELFDLIPCWLASPETVSAIFPLQSDTFDLVIFDEASQCYIEHGLPAALRGKQVIIAGDSQQLQPSDLYQVRYEDERGEDEPLLEIDSLLDVASQYLPQTQLREHYRSKSLDLIAFSNKHFYKDKLNLLPYYQYINNQNPSISYIKTDGTWENNQNKIEAQKVLEIVKGIDTTLSIGVVTFNYKQAELIDNLLRNELEFQENIRVKNIENIQGDEFDVVIFSIGYAPNKNEKLLMNFGTLNQQGGKNRLNVAVTRARSKIYVVVSILPQQLNVENSLNSGPKLLRDYLQYALEVSEGNLVTEPYYSAEFQSKNTLKNYLRNQIQHSGSQLTEELPFADLTVSKNGKYESLILTDDGIYFDSLSSKNTHGYLPLLLNQKGWKFERRWSREVSK